MPQRQSMKHDADTDALIDELAQSTPDAVRQMRHHARLTIRMKVFVEPASLSHRDGVRLQGVTGDLSAGGAQILVPRPLLIGDVYEIWFDRDELDLPAVYALCLRGRTIRPDAYEAGLRFLEPVTLPVNADANTRGSII